MTSLVVIDSVVEFDTHAIDAVSEDYFVSNDDGNGERHVANKEAD